MLFVANLKMQLSFNQTRAYACDNNWHPLTNDRRLTIVICPSFDALYALATEKVPFALGAQDCSAYPPGPYTGQVLAESLAQIKCSYCIIGHAETRSLLGQSDELIARKANRLLEHNITPIICLSSDSALVQNELNGTLIPQIAPLIAHLPKQAIQKHLYVAYEPLWAIGTGQEASPEHIATVLTIVRELVQELRSSYTIKFLYGGSVTEKNASILKKIPGLDGLLIGKAALDFKKFETIVLS